MLLDRDLVQVLRQGASQALSSEVRGDGDGTDVGVPVLNGFIAFVPLYFANEVALDVAHAVFTDDAVLAPLV